MIKVLIEVFNYDIMQAMMITKEVEDGGPEGKKVILTTSMEKANEKIEEVDQMNEAYMATYPEIPPKHFALQLDIQQHF